MERSTFVSITERVQLTDLGIKLADIKWSKLRVTSNLYFCITHKKGDRFISTVYDERCDKVRSFELDGLLSSQVNPGGSRLALATPYKIFAVNLEDNHCISWNRFPCELNYWSWISNDSIVIVGPEFIFLWTVAHPTIKPLCIRHRRTRQGQITGCQVDPDHRWAILTTLYQEPDEPVSGRVQVYSSFYDHSDCIEAHAALLTRHKFSGHDEKSQLLILAKKCSSTSAKISIVDISMTKNAMPSVKSEKFAWTREDDFPISIVHSESKGLIYLFSKFGSLCVFDIDNCSPLIISEQVCPDIVFATTLDGDGEGVFAFLRNGQVLGIQLGRKDKPKSKDEQVTRL